MTRDAVLGRVSDEIWKEIGRPVADPALSVLFPGGVSYYADASLDKQPARMDLLAELLHSRIHPRLLLEQVKVHARDIRAAAKELRTAVDAVPGPNERVELLQRVRRALATVAHADLTSLKRLYKNAHFSQADIHAVIPDRPSSARTPDQGRRLRRLRRLLGRRPLPIAGGRVTAVFGVYTRVGGESRARTATGTSVGPPTERGIGRLQGRKCVW